MLWPKSPGVLVPDSSDDPDPAEEPPVKAALALAAASNAREMPLEVRPIAFDELVRERGPAFPFTSFSESLEIGSRLMNSLCSNWTTTYGREWMDGTLSPRAWRSLTWSWPRDEVVVPEFEGVAETVVEAVCVLLSGGACILKSGGFNDIWVVGSAATFVGKPPDVREGEFCVGVVGWSAVELDPILSVGSVRLVTFGLSKRWWCVVVVVGPGVRAPEGVSMGCCCGTAVETG